MGLNGLIPLMHSVMKSGRWISFKKSTARCFCQIKYKSCSNHAVFGEPFEKPFPAVLSMILTISWPIIRMKTVEMSI